MEGVPGVVPSDGVALRKPDMAIGGDEDAEGVGGCQGSNNISLSRGRTLEWW